MYVDCEGFVLRKYRYSETSYILHLFTREYGRINALAKGARRSNSQMYGHFDLFNLEEITVFQKRRSDLDLATAANILVEFRKIRSIPVIFACATTVSEIILKSCMLYDKHELSFLSFKDLLLQSEDHDFKPVSSLIGVIWLVLRDLGFEPAVDYCRVCNKKDLTSFVLSPEHGGVVCAECATARKKIVLDAGDLAGLRCVVGNNQSVRVSFHKYDLLAAIGEYTEYVLGVQLKSLSFLAGILNGARI